MLGKVIAVIVSLAVIYSINSFAQTTSSVYSVGVNSEDTLTLLDNKKTVGEEMILLETQGSVKTIKVLDVSVDSFGGSYLVSDEDGTVQEDLTIEVVFNSRYQQILKLLADKKFRAAFTEIPETCPAEATGFLIVNDNLTAEAYGYCLVPR